MLRKTITAIVMTSILLLLSCSRNDRIIPKDVMSGIYYDIYMTDEAVNKEYKYRKMVDTMLLYEPIFKKYGYTTEDYIRSLHYYLARPDKFEDVFEDTKAMLERRKAQLESILEAEGKRPRLWSFTDSLELYTSDGIHAPSAVKSMRVMFFKPDTAVPSSPVIDTVFLERPTNAFMIFDDSASMAESRFKFYSTKGMMDDVKELMARRDSLESSVSDSLETNPVMKAPSLVTGDRFGPGRRTLRTHNVKNHKRTDK